MSEVKRKKGESFEAFLRRGKQQWMRSGRVFQVRKVQFFTKKKSKNVARTQAVAYARQNSKIAYLRKIGRLPEEEPRRNNRRN